MTRDELLKLVFYFVAALAASLIRFLKKKKKSFSVFVIEMLTGASIAFFVVPAIVDHYSLTLSFGTGLTWVLTMISEHALRYLENKFDKKVDDVVDNIDE